MTGMDHREPGIRASIRLFGRGDTGQPLEFVETAPSVFDSKAKAPTIRVKRWAGTVVAALALGCAAAAWLVASYLLHH